MQVGNPDGSIGDVIHNQTFSSVLLSKVGYVDDRPEKVAQEKYTLFEW